MESSRCRLKRLTKNYIKLTLAPEMGQGIMVNTVRESQENSFLKLSFNVSVCLLLCCSLFDMEAEL